MPVTPQDIARLLVLRLSGELTAEQAATLVHWERQSRKHRAVSEELGDDHQIRLLLDQRSEDEQNNIHNHLLQKVRLLIAADGPSTMTRQPVHRVHFLKTAWFKYAAAVLLIFGTVAYFYFNAPPTHPAVTDSKPVPVKNDVLPGRGGAILKLADGRQVVLDSLHNGVIAQENGSDVVLQNGAVRYDAGGRSATVAYNTMSTPRGRQFQLVLPDGSKVWLNAASSIRYPTVFTGKRREVEIDGEAYFKVAKNFRMPFIVKVDEQTRVQVLGTSFNIKSYADEKNVQATLIEGAVKVIAGEQQLTLAPGQQAMAGSDDLTLNSNADIEQVMAWKNGYFRFRGSDIQTIMRQLEKWYDIDVIYEKPIDDLFVATIPRTANLSSVFTALQKTGGVRFIIHGKTVTVTQ